MVAVPESKITLLPQHEKLIIEEDTYLGLFDLCYIWKFFLSLLYVYLGTSP